MKKRVLSALFVVMVLGIVGCGKESNTAVSESDPGAVSAQESRKVVYSIPGLSAPIWTAASQGFTEKAEALGWEAEVLDPNDNLETQISQLENMMIKGVSGIVITPIDGEATSTLMGECEAEDIPVVAIDRQVSGNSLTTVEADNYSIGQALGELYIESLGEEEGKVLIVGGPLSSSATVNRTEGFKSVIEGKDNIEIVAESATEMDSEIVLAAVTNYLQANPDITCIMSCTDHILPAIITALDEAEMLYPVGENGHVSVFSVDGDGYGLSQVRDGFIDATYALDPAGWAEAAVEALNAHFNGEMVEESVYIEGNVVTKENFEKLLESGELWGADSME